MFEAGHLIAQWMLAGTTTLGAQRWAYLREEPYFSFLPHFLLEMLWQKQPLVKSLCVLSISHGFLLWQCPHNTIVCFSTIKLLVCISQVRLGLVIVTSKPNPSGLKESRLTSTSCSCSISMAGGQGLSFILFSVGDRDRRSHHYLKHRWSPSQSDNRALVGPPSAVKCSCLEVTCIALLTTQWPELVTWPHPTTVVE